MPKITSQQYATALFDAVSETAPHDHDKVLDNFVKILAQNGDLGKYDEIDTEFRKLKLESQGIKEAEVTVAREAELNHTIIKELNDVVQARGLPQKLEIKQKIDESIIGGVIVRVSSAHGRFSITKITRLDMETVGMDSMRAGRSAHPQQCRDCSEAHGHEVDARLDTGQCQGGLREEGSPGRGTR